MLVNTLSTERKTEGKERVGSGKTFRSEFNASVFRGSVAARTEFIAEAD